MDLEINTTSSYFCFFSSIPCAIQISKWCFQTIHSSPCWTLTSNAQKEVNRGPKGTEVCFVSLVGCFLRVMFALVNYLGSLTSLHLRQNIDSQMFGPWVQRTLWGSFSELSCGPSGTAGIINYQGAANKRDSALCTPWPKSSPHRGDARE